MMRPLKLLLAEDNPDDADLLLLTLREAGFEPQWMRVETEAAFIAELHAGLDLVVSDFQMPQFNGMRALELLKESGLEVPFILVSGTVGEDIAVLAMKNGATDYLLKDRLARLGSAVAHALAESRAVGEQRRAEASLRASEQRFKALFEQAAVGVAQADAKTGCFLKVNRRFCEIVGRSQEEMEELTFAAIVHPQDVGEELETARLLNSGAIRESTREKRCLRKDGSEVWISQTVSAMWSLGEAPDYVIAVVHDITEKKLLEEHFRQAQKMEAIGTLAGGIAHDFNNILTAIISNTELAQMILKENLQARIHLAAVLQASNRAAHLVRQILTFSRHQPPERRPMDLRAVLQETLTLLRASIPSSIQFDTSLATDTPTVLADATQVHQILMNLGTNAWHAMKDQTGRMQVKLERWEVTLVQAAAQPRLHPGTYARLSVGDSGSGMDPATLRRIFEPFFTTKAPGEGTGLGLAVVHGIMEHHDGAITVESQPGQGTVFQLYFPLHTGVAILAPAKDGPTPRGHGEVILVVDDEPMITQLVQHVLVALGYQVEWANEPESALALVQADPQRFALVLTDHTMPGMTGILLATLLRKIRPSLPVIMMTGYSAALVAERVAAVDIRALLLKPVTIHALGVAVHAALPTGNLALARSVQSEQAAIIGIEALTASLG